MVFEIESFDEETVVRTYTFVVNHAGKSYEGIVVGTLGVGDIVMEHTLRWLTPGHPNLDPHEERDLIDQMFDTM